MEFLKLCICKHRLFVGLPNSMATLCPILFYKQTSSKMMKLYNIRVGSFITFLSPLRGSPSSTMASRMTPQSYFLL